LTEINGVKEWRLNNLLHREDGPAVEYSFGTKLYFLNGQLHRVDGPAIEWRDGTKHWCLNGKLHREDGPAIEYNDGGGEWHVNGKRIPNPKEFISQHLMIFDASTLSSLWNLFPNRDIEFKVFAKVFHELAKENLISVIKIKNKKTDFIDYIAVSNNFEVI
jgi:hypothetical protein